MPKQQYDESSIVILEGLDAVRKRPGMYIGSTDSKGLHHLVWEIVDNAIDEALNGYGDEITITLEKDGSVTVEDHGRGMPVGKHKSGVSTLQVIFTILHAGGKFTSHGGYTSAGGLHGVGASVVNALCTWCKVMVHDGKDVWSMTFEDGGSKIGKLEKVGKTNHTGSIVSFKPDPSIFKSVHFSYSTICERAQEDAFLLKGLKMIVRDKRKEEREVVYQYEDGLKAFIEEVNQDHTPMHDPISFRGESNQIIVEGCFQYTDEYQENIFSFTNMVRTRDGGSHETGAKQAFTKVFNEYARKNGFLKEKDKGFDGNDVREGLTLVINLTIPEDYLQFEGQTKNKLGTPEAKNAVEQVVYEQMKSYLAENGQISSNLIARSIRAAKAREAAKKARDEVRMVKQKTSKPANLIGKLTPAQYKNPDKNELFLVEGDSAGGTAKQGRDRSFQAILPLRGKVINTAKAKIEEVLKNEEIMSIINAIGGGFGPDFDVTKSNYSKVIIMTDADTDGAHIQILLLTFFYRYMKQLVEKGMVYIATPPLYKITSKNGIEYAWTDEELREKIQKKNVQIQRYKGLGEMNDEQLWETTMDPTKRTLIQVLIGEDGDAENKMEILMGDDVEPRREWIENNVVFDNDDNFILEDVSEDE